MKPPVMAMTYAKCFAAQVGALGPTGQRRLQRSTVLIVGVGGLGTSICTTLALAGVGRLLILDPQRIEAGNLNRFAFMRPSDIGKLKVDVVSSFFDGRPHVQVVPFVGRAEALDALDIGDNIDLVVSSSNSVSSRIAVAKTAVGLGVPHVSAALTDGRQSNRGFVTAWVPASEGACPACFLRPHAIVPRNDSLLASTIGVVGTVAAALAVRVVSAGDARSVVNDANCVTIDADAFTMEPFRVLRRPDCPACGRPRRRGHVRP